MSDKITVSLKFNLIFASLSIEYQKELKKKPERKKAKRSKKKKAK